MCISIPEKMGSICELGHLWGGFPGHLPGSHGHVARVHLLLGLCGAAGEASIGCEGERMEVAVDDELQQAYLRPGLRSFM